jgi:hypothetical protein
MPIEIDVSEVPVEKQTDARFVSLRDSMVAGLCNPVIFNAVCIHEAAHIFYATQANAPVTGHKTPRIVYDPQRNEFDGYQFSVVIDVVNKEALKTDKKELLLTRAKLYAAGGVAARELTNVLAHLGDTGDQQDRSNFESFCDAIGLLSAGEREATWLWAQQQVALDLRKPTLRAHLWQMAKLVKPLLSEKSTP